MVSFFLCFSLHGNETLTCQVGTSLWWVSDERFTSLLSCCLLFKSPWCDVMQNDVPERCLSFSLKNGHLTFKQISSTTTNQQRTEKKVTLKQTFKYNKHKHTWAVNWPHATRYNMVRLRERTKTYLSTCLHNGAFVMKSSRPFNQVFFFFFLLQKHKQK